MHTQMSARQEQITGRRHQFFRVHLQVFSPEWFQELRKDVEDGR